MSKIFAVWDSKVEAYLTPFFMRTKGEAVRAWQSVVNDPKTNFAKYPGDYTLMEIGEYDEYSGNIKGHEKKVAIGTALEFKSSAIGSALGNISDEATI